MRVAVLHPSGDKDGRWIDDFAPQGARYEFYRVPPIAKPTSWHMGGSKTSSSQWTMHLQHVDQAFKTLPDVVVTNFPQLALAAGVRKTWSVKQRPQIVGWSYNLGDIGNPLKGKGSGVFLRNVDRLIVHSREEIARYAAWHGLAEERFSFVPLQRGAMTKMEPSEDEPFAVAMGSAGRDYLSLLEAASGFDGKIVLVCKPDLVAGMTIPPNVEVRHGMSLAACEELNAKARFSIVPISNLTTASGQVTFLMSMALGCPVIATDCPGTRDYLIDGQGAVIVPPLDPDALRAAMNRLWHDDEARSSLGKAAYAEWSEKFSDPVAGANLTKILDDVTGAASHP
ncbi:MAG: glycosyltransferase family 4 protein [Pseudomonadota bacterium]